jgi:mono/diheme cytochrome c family protein
MTLSQQRMSRASIVALLSLTVAPISAQDDKMDFGRQIRPLLAEKCFACHGLDGETRATDLRMDTNDGLFAMLESGGVGIVPGDLDKSLIYQRLTSEDEDERMPPAEAEKQLSEEEIDLVRRWIDQGAEWQQHWAWVAPQRPQLPKIDDTAWPRNEIDHFVQARLEKEGLDHSATADRVTLIRRATFDLTGLPPTPGEVDDFLADQS